MRKILNANRYLSIYAENPFTYKEDIYFMNERLKFNNTIYFVSGEANHNLHNYLEESYKDFLSDKNKTINIQAGPIISVPETSGSKPQEKRAFDNTIIKLARDNMISFYPRDSYSPDQYRIFMEENLILLFEPHYINGRTNRVWFLENADIELSERIKYFNKVSEGNGKLTERFNNNLIFLTSGEIDGLMKWAIRENIDSTSISYKDCKRFLDEVLNKN